MQIKNIMSRNNVVLFLIVVVLIWYHFYIYAGFQNIYKLLDYISYGMFFMMLFYSTKEISIKKHKYPTLIFISTIISAIMAIVFWDEKIISEFRVLHNYQLIIIYFVLSRMKAEGKDVEKALVILALIYVACWLFQISQVPQLVFGADHNTDISDTEQRGFFRFFIPTKENMPILLFFTYELYRRTKRILFLLIIPILILMIILHVGRQMIAWSLVSFVLLILYHNRKKWKSLVAATVLLYAIGNYSIEKIPTLGLLFEQTNKQVESADDDIRLACFKYYWDNSVSNPITFVFGNGIGAEGQLGIFTKKATTLGYYESDIGFMALLFDFGLLGLLIYLFLFFYIIRIPVEKKYIYIKCYFIYIYGSYILAHNLTTNILFNMCAFYILYFSNMKIKSIKKNC